MGQECLGSLCRVSIHKDILKELEEKNKLHDLIAEQFIDKPRRLNFLDKYSEFFLTLSFAEELSCKSNLSLQAKHFHRKIFLNKCCITFAFLFSNNIYNENLNIFIAVGL